MHEHYRRVLQSAVTDVKQRPGFQTSTEGRVPARPHGGKRGAGRRVSTPPAQLGDIVYSCRQKLAHLPALHAAKENIEQIRARLVLDTKDGRIGCDLASADRFALLLRSATLIFRSPPFVFLRKPNDLSFLLLRSHANWPASQPTSSRAVERNPGACSISTVLIPPDDGGSAR